MFVDAAPEKITRGNFDDSQWLPAVVPGTVLGSYLALGAIPDPYFGGQMSQISEDFFFAPRFLVSRPRITPVKKSGWILTASIGRRGSLVASFYSSAHASAECEQI